LRFARVKPGAFSLVDESAPSVGAVAVDEPIVTPIRAPAGSLELLGIEKRWQRKGPTILKGIDLVARPGTTTWIGGANGVGKTTLLRIATGAIMPDRGTVSLGGLSPERDRRAYHRRIAFLAAGDRTLYARLSVRRHLDFWARLALMDPVARATAVEAALERFYLQELAERRADRMSMGQRQRVRLAGTFLHNPSLVLLDEPQTSLDEEGLAVLEGVCSEVVQRGGMVLWCSPARQDARLAFDEAWVIRDGELCRA
jgi:ABC-type multidrug transport system ATPase subunit